MRLVDDEGGSLALRLALQELFAALLNLTLGILKESAIEVASVDFDPLQVLLEVSEFALKLLANG